MKISSMIVGLILISLITFSMAQYIVNVNDNYDDVVDESTLEGYDKLVNLSNVAQDTKDSVNELNANQNILDVLSSFVTSAYTAFKTSFTSVDIATDIVQQGAEDLTLGREYSDGIKSILIISLFIGVIIAAIVKWRT